MLTSLRYQITNIEEERSLIYLSEYYRQIAKEISGKPKTYSACASTFLHTVSLDFYYHHRNIFPQAVREKLDPLENLRSQHLQSLCSQLNRYHSGATINPTNRKVLSIILDCLGFYIDLIRLTLDVSEGIVPWNSITRI